MFFLFLLKDFTKIVIIIRLFWCYSSELLNENVWNMHDPLMNLVILLAKTISGWIVLLLGLLERCLLDGHLKVLWIFQLCIPVDHTIINTFINRLSKGQTIEWGFVKLSFCASSDDRVSFFRFLLFIVVLAGINEFLIIYFCILAVIDSTTHLRLCGTHLLFILL